MPAVEWTLYGGFETQGVYLPTYEQTKESDADVEANLRAKLKLNHVWVITSAWKCVEMLHARLAWTSGVREGAMKRKFTIN